MINPVRQNAQGLSEDDFAGTVCRLHSQTTEGYSSTSQIIDLTYTFSLWRLAGGLLLWNTWGWFFLNGIFYLIFFFPCGSILCINMFAVQNSNELKEENTHWPCFFFNSFFVCAFSITDGTLRRHPAHGWFCIPPPPTCLPLEWCLFQEFWDGENSLAVLLLCCVHSEEWPRPGELGCDLCPG